MRLSIRHTTRYRFNEPVTHGLQRLRLTPKATQGQTVLDWAMDYRGTVPQVDYEDQNHNRVTLVSVVPGAEEVTITSQGTVETEDRAGVIGMHAGHLPLWAFLGATELTRPGPRIKQLIAGVKRSGEGMVPTLHNLSAAIREQVSYESGVTDVDTAAEEAVAAGRGVCQDHAHIFIAAARQAGIPARYVTGYLFLDDPEQAVAHHAWAEAWVAGLGSVGFDAANGVCPIDHYVRLAAALDARYAAPIRGMHRGGAGESLAVEVKVQQTTPQQ